MLKLNKDKGKDNHDEPDTDKQEHMKKYAKFYESGVLNYEQHSMMIPNLEFYATQAKIPLHYLYSSCKDLITDLDLQYFDNWVHLIDKKICGAYLTKHSERYVERMYCMVAIMLRNLHDAKFLTIQEVVKELKAGGRVDSRFVCVPNFCLPKKQGGDMATWEMSSIVGWLLERQSMGYQTVLYVENLKDVEIQYGTVVKQLLANHMQPLK